MGIHDCSVLLIGVVKVDRAAGRSLKSPAANAILSTYPLMASRHNARCGRMGTNNRSDPQIEPDHRMDLQNAFI
jgi:hypothetical protein